MHLLADLCGREELPELRVGGRAVVAQASNNEVLRRHHVELALQSSQCGDEVTRGGGDEWTVDQLAPAHHFRLTIKPPEVAVRRIEIL